MSTDLEALGRRYLEAGGPWRLDGLLLRHKRGLGPDNRHRVCLATTEDPVSFGTWWPDLSDRATQGAVLGWLHDSRNPHLSVRYYGCPKHGDSWAVVSTSRSVSVQVGPHAPTRAEALVAAVEALKGAG